MTIIDANLQDHLTLKIFTQSIIIETLRQELLLAFRSRKELMNPLAFFGMVVALFPLAVSTQAPLLQAIAPGVIWVVALLATLLSLDRLFLLDYVDGTLQQWVMSPQSLSLLIGVKVFAHWLVTGLPLILITPLLAIWMQLPSSTVWALVASLLIGTPVFHLIGAMGAGLTVGLRHAGMLLPLLVIPLYIPALILGTSAVMAANHGLPFVGQLAWLGVLLCISICSAPLATAAALRCGVN